METGGCLPSHQEGGNLIASQLTLSGATEERENMELGTHKTPLKGFPSPGT